MPSPAAQSKENLQKSFCVYNNGSNKITSHFQFFFFFFKFSLRFKTHFGILCSTVNNANKKMAKCVLTSLKSEEPLFNTALIALVGKTFIWES